MANSKISALTSATTPLAGTEVVPLVQSSTTKKVAVSDLTAGRDVSGKSFIAATGPLISKGALAALAASEVFVDQPLTTLSRIGVVGPDDSTKGAFRISQYSSAGSLGTDVIDIDSSSNIKFNTGNIVQGTAAKGINFTANTPAAGMTSQLLNWYEQGTWTPSLGRATTGPTVTYTTQAGFYTRVGRQVTVTAVIAWSANSGGSGAWTVTGLPFANGNTANMISSAATGDYSGVTLPTGTTQLTFETSANSTVLIFVAGGSGVSSNTISTVAASGSIYFTLTYFA